MGGSCDRDFQCTNGDRSRQASMSRGSVCNQEKKCSLKGRVKPEVSSLLCSDVLVLGWPVE